MPSASLIAICRVEHRAFDGHKPSREAIRPSALRGSGLLVHPVAVMSQFGRRSRISFRLPSEAKSCKNPKAVRRYPHLAVRPAPSVRSSPPACEIMELVFRRRRAIASSIRSSPPKLKALEWVSLHAPYRTKVL